MNHLVVFNKQLGDAVLLEPTLARLARESGRGVRLITRRRVLPLLELMPGVDFAGELGFRQADELWCYDASSRAAFQVLACRSRHKQLLVADRDLLHPLHRLAFHSRVISPYGDRYMARYYWEETAAGPATGYRPPRLEQPPESWAKTNPPPEGGLLLNPTAAWRSKCYPAERWAEVLHALAALRIGPLILVGGGEPWQQEHCAEIRAHAPAGLVDVAGRTTLREYLHLLSRARLVLTVDGSASHLAQAFGRATLTLFGPTVARWWHCPTPQNVRLDGADFAGFEAPPTESIPAAAVVQTAVRLWEGTTSG